MATADVGGGNAYGFNPADANTYHDVQTRGLGSIDYTMHWTSHSFAGYTYNDGKADALHKVQQGIKLQNLQDKTQSWDGVHTHTSDIAGRLKTAYGDTFAAWSGDDADTAQTTFGHTVNSAAAISDYSSNVHTGMSQITKGAQSLLGAGASGPGTGAEIANVAIGFNIGGDGDGGAALQHYEDFVTAVDGGRNSMPASMQWQVKTQAGQQLGGDQTPPVTPSNGSGGAGVGGVSAPNSGVSTPGHGSVNTPHITQPKTPPHTNTNNNNDQGRIPHEPPTTDPGAGGTTGTGGTTGVGSGGTGGVPGVGSSGIGGTGAGSGGGGIGSLPHVGADGGSTLAGLDGGAGGGAGLGAGAGGLGAGGGVSGLGAGAGAGGGGFGGGAGAGLIGGGGSGLAGEDSGTRSSGIGSASGAAGAGEGAGANGTGRGTGMMPMRGGGAGGGGDDERERSTWLEEDDDVWGESDAPPSVIS